MSRARGFDSATFSILLLLINWFQLTGSFNISFKESEPNNLIEGTVNFEHQDVYRFKIPESHTNDSSIRVEFSSSINSSKKCPIYFVVRQRNEIQTIELPQDHEARNLTVYTGARTLCFLPEDWTSFIFVTVSTCNLDNVTYSLKLSIQNGYIIRLNEPKVAENISSTAPIFYRFAFPENVRFVNILANCSTKSTTFISIQPPWCPVRDELSNIKHHGHWHTMSENTALIVQKADYTDGFILLFLPDPTTNLDHRINDPSHLETISFVLVDPPDLHDVVIPSLWIPMLYYSLLILLVYILFSCFHHQFVGGSRHDFTPEFLNRMCPINFCETSLRVESFTAESKLYKYLKANSYRYFWTTLTIVFFYGLPVTLLSLTLIKFAKNTGDLGICHFNYKCSYPYWIFTSFNHVYSCLGFIIFGLTFMLLVHVRATKLVVNEVRGGALLGEAEPPGPWNFCRFRQINLTGTVYGAYQNFGTFYTLGFTLMFVGIMKMAYNTCPSKDTTFFGLTFMFIIVLLCQIKVYNLRHPCMVTDNFTFMSIGLIIGTVTIAYVITDKTFQIAISVFISFWIQIAVLILQSAGYVEAVNRRNSDLPAATSAESEDPKPESSSGTNMENFSSTIENRKLVNSPTALFRSVCCSFNFRPLFTPEWKRRTFWTVSRLLVNIGILTFIWVEMNENHFTTRMYILVLSNFLLDFCAYFIIHKGFHHEYSKFTSWQPLIYLIFALISWVFSLTALATSLGAWELPTVLLQQQFTPCIFGIYDALDMYHWLAAPAWFFTFMVMLTADDQLSRNRTEMTVVF